MASFSAPVNELIPQLHPEDQAIVSGLGDVDAILEWVSLRVNEYHRRIAPLLSIRNALLPIQRLPREVLREIFANPCLGYRDLTLMLVSRYWRSVVLDTPQFWANVLAGVSFGNDTPLLSACISRSGILPLRAQGEWSTLMWKRLAEAKHRIYELGGDIPNPKFLSGGFQDGIQKMTRLVRLDMKGRRLEFGSQPPHFTYDANHLPRLRDLSLFQIGFRPSVEIPSLKSLSLKGVDYSLLEMMKILGKCPNVVDLHIFPRYHSEDRQPTSWLADLGKIHEPVTLPHLKTATMYGAKMVPLLTRISHPASAELSLDIICIDQGSSAVMEACAPLLLHQSFDCLLIFTEARGPSNCIAFCFYARGQGELQLNVTFGQSSGQSSSRVVSVSDAHTPVFLHSFRAMSITTLSLDLPSLVRSLGNADMVAQFCHLVFDSLPHVVRLELPSYTELDDEKRNVAKQFLRDRKDRGVRDLTLVWDMPPAYPPDLTHDGSVDNKRSGSDHLQDLMDMLKDEACVGNTRLRLRLRLWRPEPSEGESDDAGRLPPPELQDVLDRFDESILEELGEWVDELLFSYR